MTPQQKKRLGEIETEWVEVSYKRFECDMTAAGQKRWEELWARGQELAKQRDKLLKEAGDVQPNTTTNQPAA